MSAATYHDTPTPLRPSFVVQVMAACARFAVSIGVSTKTSPNTKAAYSPLSHFSLEIMPASIAQRCC